VKIGELGPFSIVVCLLRALRPGLHKRLRGPSSGSRGTVIVVAPDSGDAICDQWQQVSHYRPVVVCGKVVALGPPIR